MLSRRDMMSIAAGLNLHRILIMPFLKNKFSDFSIVAYVVCVRGACVLARVLINEVTLVTNSSDLNLCFKKLRHPDTKP